MRRRLVVLAILASLGAHPAAARERAASGLRYKAGLDVPLTVAGLAGSLGPKLLTDEGGVSTCRWCDRDASGHDTLNGLDAAVRRHWRWDDVEKAHRWSNATLALSFVAPVGAFAAARDGFGHGFGEEMLLVLESSALTLGVTQGTKYLFRRERPWAHAKQVPDGERLGSPDSTLSFASGHASLAFSLAVSTGSLASLRGDRGKEWVWATGLTFATATAYLRIGADRHYLTDVLAGAAIGAAVGWAVPRLVDRRPAKGEEGVRGARRETPVPLFSLALGTGRAGSPGRAVLLTGGVQGGGAFVSAAWGF
jgi:membrane-associated phospholipid phosphatase